MERGVGIGGLADNKEAYTTSRFNHYAPYSFETEVKTTFTFDYPPAPVRPEYDSSLPITFSILEEKEMFTKIKTIKLHGNLKVWNETTNAEPAATEVWSLCNNYTHSLFSNVSCQIGDHEIVDSSSQPYGYKAYLENLLVPTAQYQQAIMCADGWYKDESQTCAMSSASFVARRKNIERGGVMEFIMPVHHDIITCTRELPPDKPLKFRFIRAPDKFVIWSPATNGMEDAKSTEDPKPIIPYVYKIILTDLRLSISKVVCADRIFNHYFNAGPGKLPEIPFTRNLIRSYTTSANNTDLGQPYIIQNKQLPEAIYVVFVDQQAYDGDQTLNPFNFETLILKEVSLIVNGRHEPMSPLSNVVEEYRRRDFYEHFLENTGRDHFNSQAVNISMDDYFDNGYFILAWDRTASSDNRFQRHTMDRGWITLNLKLATAAPKKYQVIMYCSYSDAIILDGKSVTSSIRF